MEPSALVKNDRDLQPGQKVGEYVVEAKIGEGGFGTVYRAAHPLIGKLAAIKLLSRQYSADPEMVSRFVAEARAVNQIRHRNIIDIFAFGQIEDGRSYYVMEFLDGAPLDQYLAERGALPLGEAIPVLRAVARALDAAHAKGIAHRDLKPENIFLVQESDGTVFPKLLDFGIAKLLGAASGGAMHKTRTGAPIGTPYYMSPEQCRGRDVDHRTDIYAFGVVAYRALTGVVPFDGEDYMDILIKQIGEEPVPPSQRVTSLPRTVDDAIAWMMKKDPAARPPNLITAMRALEDAAQAAGVDLAPDTASGLYTVPSQVLSAQRTPSGMTPPPSRTPGGTLGNAATLDAQQLAGAADATRSAEGRAVAPAPTAAPTLDVPRRSRAPLVLALSLAGAVVAGAIVFFALGGGDGEGGEEAAAQVADRGAAPPEPPPPPPPVAVDAAEVTPPPAPSIVTITIDGPPPGTEVYGPGGKLVGVAPGEVQLDRGDLEVVLTFKADGHVATTTKITPTEDQAIEVTLAAKDRKPDRKPDRKSGGGKRDGDGKRDGGKGDKGGPSGRDTLEDPFGQK